MKVELYPWIEDDIPSLIQYANNINVYNKVRDSFPHPYTRTDAEEWITLNRHIDPVRNFCIRVEEKLAGGTGLILKEGIYRKNAEIGFWIGEPLWGNGIATEAVHLLVNYAFATFDLVRIYAEVFSNNPASMKVLLKNGFHQEAVLQKALIKNDQLLDAHIWVKLRTGEAMAEKS